MGIFGKSDKEKEQEAQKAYQQAQRRLQEAKRKQEREQQAAARAGQPQAPRAGTAPVPGNVPAGQRGPVGANVPAAQAPAPAAGAGQSYKVAKGDNLSKIAKKHLGDADRWREIYEANKGVIGDDPDLIKPGQVLRIPGGGQLA
jgi:nucleoid-associated protein YgaU